MIGMTILGRELKVLVQRGAVNAAVLALVLVIEGALPFINPNGFRQTLLKASELDDSVLRFAGLTAMILGCLLLYVVR